MVNNDNGQIIAILQGHNGIHQTVNIDRGQTCTRLIQ